MRENLTYGLMRRGRNYLPFTLVLPGRGHTGSCRATSGDKRLGGGPPAGKAAAPVFRFDSGMILADTAASNL
ncbi:hypothetical protein SAMN02744124_04133 [Paenibacillus barengoltzii J12]|uniref:Uncharacterized protein n=1 Tax=Paenibacillus barengoltzii J12 TaxID=935846 RepID=A0ABY1M5K6_9BACL|nr:hypothetical protein SAMN02744124_04133 [Paenibacillus barengoltzii J12]